MAVRYSFLKQSLDLTQRTLKREGSVSAFAGVGASGTSVYNVYHLQLSATDV